jgi:hypothetical protein
MGYLLKVGLAIAGLVLLISPVSTAGEIHASGIEPTEPVQAESGPDLSHRVTPRKIRAFSLQMIKFEVKVKNAGDLASGRVRIKAHFPKSRLTRTRAVNQRITSIPAGGTRKAKFAFQAMLRVSSSARPKPVARFKVAFRLIENGEPMATVKSKVIIPPIQILDPIKVKIPVTG